MKTTKIFKELLFGIIVMAPLLYFFYLWNSLPNTIPIHFNMEGNADYYAGKKYGALTLFVLSIGIYGFLSYIPKINKKNNLSISGKTFTRYRLMLYLIFSILNFLIVLSIQQEKAFSTLIYATIAILLSIIGNYMSALRKDYSNAEQLQETKNHESEWRKTQNFIGKLWFFSGIALAICIFILPANLKLYGLLIGLVTLMVIVPSIYSYSVYLKNKKYIDKNKFSEKEQESPQNVNSNSENWVGLFYFNRSDKRLLVPKRTPGMGWTLNFANPYSYILLIAIVSIIVITNYLT